MHTHTDKLIANIRILLFLCSLLVVNNCSCNEPSKTIEAILFLGNSGAGKSTLCNSVFQEAVFSSGVSLYSGMTLYNQAHTYHNTLYIDTPGLSELLTRERVAKEIEVALKKNLNYKIVFVITLISGSLYLTDIAAIDRVCDAIRVPFEYGLIFNKVSQGLSKAINQEGLDSYLALFKKKPSATVILTLDREIEDEDNRYFKPDSENRKKLLEFLSKLKSTLIHESDVKSLNIANYGQRP